MLFLIDGPLHCQKRVFQRSSYCSLINVTPQKLKGVQQHHASNSSNAMRFSNYARNFGRSRGVPEDLCRSGNMQNVAAQMAQAPVACTNPIFSPNWSSKSTNCGCGINRYIVGNQAF